MPKTQVVSDHGWPCAVFLHVNCSRADGDSGESFQWAVLSVFRISDVSVSSRA